MKMLPLKKKKKKDQNERTNIWMEICAQDILESQLWKIEYKQ